MVFFPGPKAPKSPCAPEKRSFYQTSRVNSCEIPSLVLQKITLPNGIFVYTGKLALKEINFKVKFNPFLKYPRSELKSPNLTIPITKMAFNPQFKHKCFLEIDPRIKDRNWAVITQPTGI